nr:ATP-binding protein [Actinomycetota bacterium]
RATVVRAVASVRAVADRAGSPLELDQPADEVHAEIDPRRVERIVRNLLTNALDHGEGRPVQLTVAADTHAVAVLVRDHGVGLQPDQQDLVFNRFWRGDPSRDRRTGGTGLGLSISLEDARLHGGWLQAWGAPGQGSAFRLTLPRSHGDELTSSPLPLGPDDVSRNSAVTDPVVADPMVANPEVRDTEVADRTLAYPEVPDSALADPVVADTAVPAEPGRP